MGGRANVPRGTASDGAEGVAGMAGSDSVQRTAWPGSSGGSGPGPLRRGAGKSENSHTAAAATPAAASVPHKTTRRPSQGRSTSSAKSPG